MLHFVYTLPMAIKDSNAPIYGTITQRKKELLEWLADKNNRSLSKELATAVDFYLEHHGLIEPPKPPKSVS